jgi:hypothetical protein
MHKYVLCIFEHNYLMPTKIQVYAYTCTRVGVCRSMAAKRCFPCSAEQKMTDRACAEPATKDVCGLPCGGTCWPWICIHACLRVCVFMCAVDLHACVCVCVCVYACACAHAVESAYVCMCKMCVLLFAYSHVYLYSLSLSLSRPLPPPLSISLSLPLPLSMSSNLLVCMCVRYRLHTIMYVSLFLSLSLCAVDVHMFMYTCVPFLCYVDLHTVCVCVYARVRVYAADAGAVLHEFGASLLALPLCVRSS